MKLSLRKKQKEKKKRERAALKRISGRVKTAGIAALAVAVITGGGTAYAALSADGTVNTLTYNAKNAITSGTYAIPDPPSDDYGFAGWATTKAKADAGTADFTPQPNDITNSSLNAVNSGEIKKVYAVWKRLPYVYYAVSPYGIGEDEVSESGGSGITFGPATGNMFSDYTNNNFASNKYKPMLNAHKISDATYLINDGCVSTNTTSDGTETDSSGNPVASGTSISAGRTTVTKAMMQADMDAVQDEDEAALTDNTSHTIAGDDAGTDSSGNAYRCIHYDNWATILYWNDHDPHVYDKCVTNRCSKRLVLRPSAMSTALGTDVALGMNYSTSSSEPAGDGNTYIGNSIWDYYYQQGSTYINIWQAGCGYNASLIRAKLVGSDSSTKDDYLFANGMKDKLTEDTAYISAFPKAIREKMAHKKADYNYNSEAAWDRLWLFSYNEMSTTGLSAKYTRLKNVSPASNWYGVRGSPSWWWLRSAGSYYSDCAYYVYSDGGVCSGDNVGYGLAVAPGFALKSGS